MLKLNNDTIFGEISLKELMAKKVPKGSVITETFGK